jgi:hypothetical protein
LNSFFLKCTDKKHMRFKTKRQSLPTADQSPRAMGSSFQH